MQTTSKRLAVDNEFILANGVQEIKALAKWSHTKIDYRPKNWGSVSDETEIVSSTPYSL